MLDRHSDFAWPFSLFLLIFTLEGVEWNHPPRRPFLPFRPFTAPPPRCSSPPTSLFLPSLLCSPLPIVVIT